MGLNSFINFFYYFDQLNASFLNIFISVHLFIKKTY